ncbi:serine/threonine-protein kinase afc2 [Quercus suber]|uniref:Serine/threonine-protein kinase afc2 n=1 Tax=Quercus suber TaxID=58331 RepID=A0AAW0K494_QUESU
MEMDYVNKIHRKIGEGTFGQVLECWDKETREMVAIKVVRSIKKYREAAMIEIDVLLLLGKYDKTGSRCVQIRNWFDYRNHIFMHDMRLIHTDLKPENILFVSPERISCNNFQSTTVYIRSPKEGTYYKRLPKSSAIKVIDFGSTAYEHQDHNYIVSTRHYRTPEVILGLGWSYPCDIWSIGCILVELCSGEALFQTHENLEHLAMMERVLGPLPQHMLKRADRHAEKYVSRCRLDWPEGAASRLQVCMMLPFPSLTFGTKCG